MSKNPVATQIEYLFLRALSTATRVLPWEVSKSLGYIMGLTSYYSIPSLRRDAFRNIGIAFGKSHSQTWIESLARRHFVHLGKLLMETILISQSDKEILSKFVVFDNCFEARFNRLLKAGKGIVAIASHIGNWEVLGLALALNGYPLHIVYRRLDNPKFDALMINLRTKYGSRVLPRERSVREGLEVLRKNEILALVADQHSARGGYFVPFFGKLASTVAGPSFFLERTRSLCVFIWTYRDENGVHHIDMKKLSLPAFPNARNSREKSKRWSLEVSSLFTKCIEDIVRKNPEQWFWLHPRWDNRPSQKDRALWQSMLGHPRISG